MKSRVTAPTTTQGSALATVTAIVAAAITLPFGESVIGVQLSAIAREFDAHGTLLQWVVNAYMLTFATSILGAGILADRLGRRRLFAAGLALVGGANAIAIVAPAIGWLIALRAVSGLGAGTLLATAPALLAARFPEAGPARARAFAAFGSAAGSGIAFGPLIGGLVMDWIGWRGVFALYLPFLALAAMLLPRLSASRGDRRTRIDMAGIVLFTAALAALVWAIEGGPGGTAGHIGLIIIALGLATALVRIERRRAYPAIEPVVFMNPIFRVMSLTMICWQIGVAVSMVYMPAVVVAGLNAPPVWAGASILPMAITLFMSTPVGPWLVAHTGLTGFVVTCVGLMVVGDGVIWATLDLGGAGTIGGVATGLALIGIGGGAANGSLDNLAMGTISPERAGMAAGVFQTVRIGSAALAVAVAGSALELGGHMGSTAGTTVRILERYATLAGLSALIMTAIAICCVVLLSARATPQTP